MNAIFGVATEKKAKEHLKRGKGSQRKTIVAVSDESIPL